MKLDQATLTALNIPKLPNEPKSHSLYGLLDECKTRIGSRRLETWIKQPLIDVEMINERLDIVEAFTQDSSFTSEIRNLLREVPDLDVIVKRIHKLRGTIKDFVSLYRFIEKLESFEEEIERYEEKKEILKKKFALGYYREQFARLMVAIDKSIDLQRVEEKNEYLMRTHHDEKLAEIDHERNEIYKQLDSIQHQMTKEMDCEVLREDLKDKIVFKIAVKDMSKLAIIDAKAGVTNKQKLSFTHPELEKLSELYIDLRLQYEAQQAVIVEKFNKIVCSYLDLFSEVSENIVEMDILSRFEFDFVLKEN